VNHHVAASTMTVLTLAGGALGVAAMGAAPASAATCSTVTVSASGPLAALVLSVSSVTVKQGGCVTFSDQTGHNATIKVDGSTVSGQWDASSAGAHVVSATVPTTLILKVSKVGAGTITVTPPPPPKPKTSPPPVSPPPAPAGGGGGTGGGTGGGGGGATGGGTGGTGGGHAAGGSGGSAGGTSPRHSGGTLSGKGQHGSGGGQPSTGGLLSTGTGFSLPSIPLNSFSHEGLAGMTDGTAPQLAPQVGATDAAGNPLPLVSSGTQSLSLAGDSSSSGNHSTIPALVAGLLILATGGGLIRTRAGRKAGRSEAVDGRHALRIHRA
jgi:plastocyanin